MESIKKAMVVLTEAVPSAIPRWLMSQAIVPRQRPLKLPYLLAYTSTLGGGVLSILDFARHKLPNVHGLTLVTPWVGGVFNARGPHAH